MFELTKDLHELEIAHEECCQLANFHINKGEVVLIYANADLVQDFINITFEDNSYTLIIVQKEHQTYPQISQDFKNHEIFYVTSASVFSLMPKINKVFMDCYAIMSDGAAINDAGSYNISIVAKEFAVPLFLLAPRYKFTPLYAFSQDTFN